MRVGGALYTVPWRFIGSHVDCRASDRLVEVFVEGELVRTWARIERGRQTNYDDYPPEKVAFFMRTPTWCRRRAGELGEHVSALVGELLSVDALHRLRSAQGVLGLADRYGASRLDAACERALLAGDPSYRTVKGILATGAEAEQAPTPGAASAPAHLHGPARLFRLEAPEDNQCDAADGNGEAS